MSRTRIASKRSHSTESESEALRPRPHWDEYFMLMAKLAAMRTTCLSRAVGAVVVVDNQVISTGYNGSVPGGPHCLDEGRCHKRSKGAPSGDYLASRAVHAEANAIGMAARRGISVEGGTMYITMAPCANCVKLLASAGIRSVVYERTYDTEQGDNPREWIEAMDVAGIRHRRLTLSRETIEQAIVLITEPTSVRHPLSREGYPAEE